MVADDAFHTPEYASPMFISEQILLDTLNLVLSYQPAHSLLRAKWHGRFDASLARQQCELLLSALPSIKATCLLNDSSEAFGEWWEAGPWIGQTFAPALAARGVRTVAWVNAMDWPSRHAVATTLPLMRGLVVKPFDFDEGEEAMHWLLATATNSTLPMAG